MIMSPCESAGRPEGSTPTNVQSLKLLAAATDNPVWKGSQGGSPDTEVKPMMKARLYRLALVAGVVAVFLEGLGASFKWN
jgi:hypothetical protein